jgi:two-component system, NarL family, invasion response regulator UvrY
MANIALADDHVLLRKGLASLVQTFGYVVVADVDNGEQLINTIENGAVPEVVLMDINMPVKDGFATTKWLSENKPNVKVLALSMLDDETSVIKMMKCGAKGYIIKDAEPDDLKRAIADVLNKGFFYSEMVTGRLMRSISNNENEKTSSILSDREIEFLKLACSELTYKEIAVQMHLSPRNIGMHFSKNWILKPVLAWLSMLLKISWYKSDIYQLYNPRYFPNLPL